MEAKLSWPGQGATAKRTQDTFVWGLGKPHPQVACETHWTDPPTHDRPQPKTRAIIRISQIRNLKYTPRGGDGPEAILCSTGQPHSAKSSLQKSTRHGRRSMLEASVRVEGKPDKAGGPVVKHTEIHGSQSMPEAIFCTSEKPDNAGSPLQKSPYTWKAV